MLPINNLQLVLWGITCFIPRLTTHSISSGDWQVIILTMYCSALTTFNGDAVSHLVAMSDNVGQDDVPPVASVGEETKV